MSLLLFATQLALSTILLLQPTRASLPASTATHQHIPHDHIATSTTIPLLNGHTINPSDPQYQPLIIFSLDSNDPFTFFLATSPSSIDDFLNMGSHSINQSHFLFTAWHSTTTIATVQALFQQRLGTLPKELALKWQTILHFTNGTTEQALGTELTATLQQWSSPRNIIVGLPTTNISRLDCRYTFCPWPSQNLKFTLVSSMSSPASACSDHSNISHPGSFMFVQLPPSSSTPTCTPAMAAAAAIKAGAKGVVLAVDSADDGTLPPVGKGANANDPGLAVPVTLVSSSAGITLAMELKKTSPQSLSLSFASIAGAGQFVAIDGAGQLEEVGWEKYSTMQMLGWTAQYLEHRIDRITQTHKPALVVPVFDNALTGSVATLTLPPAALLRQFNTIELDFSLNCPDGNMDESCSVWDRIVSITAACDGGHGHSFEVGRWINAFQRSGHWLTKTVTLPSSFGGSVCRFTFNVGLNNPWRATLNIRWVDFIPQQLSALPPSSIVPIDYVNPSESFTSSAYNINKTFTFSIPKGTTRVEIASLITGHSGCEFVSTSHHFIVNQQKTKEYNTTSNPKYYTRFMEAGTNYGCANKIVDGATPNEHGTWYFGRNGWCNGMDVVPLQWDITQSIDLSSTAPQLIDYYALAYPDGPTTNGTDQGCSGNIDQSSYVVFYI